MPSQPDPCAVCHSAPCACRARTYWLIERNDRGRAEWAKWEAHPRLEWVTDVHLADRYDWSIAAERAARIYRETTGLTLTVTEHLDVAAPSQEPSPVDVGEAAWLRECPAHQRQIERDEWRGWSELGCTATEVYEAFLAGYAAAKAEATK